MEEQGVVIGLKNGNTAIVRTERNSACASCASKKSCATGGTGEDMLVETDNAIGAAAGDRVVFSVGAGSVMKAGVLLYLVPALAFIAGVVIGQFFVAPRLPRINGDLVSGVLGLIFLIDAFVCLKIYNKVLEKRGAAMRPKLLRKV